MDDSSCDVGLRAFLEKGPFPSTLAHWLAERKTKQQYLSHTFKPAGGQLAMRDACFEDVEQTPMYLLCLRNRRGRILSYVGYNLYPIKGKRVLMLEYLCTDEGSTEGQLNRHLVALMVAWAVQDSTVRGIACYSINPQSGRMLARYFGMAKVTPEEVLDAEASGEELRPAEANQVRWAYCCRDMPSPDWRHVWQSHRRAQVLWKDKEQELPFFNMHINLDAPGVRLWLARLMNQPPRL